MDSIRFDLRGFYTKERQVITIEKIKRQRGFKVAPNASFGYGLMNGKPDVYIGIGISYIF